MEETLDSAFHMVVMDITQFGTDLDESLEGSFAEDLTMSCGDLNSGRSASSPSQHAFHDWFRERRVSDESEWQPDLAEICLQLAGEDFRVFALEETNSALSRADSSSTISEMNSRFVNEVVYALSIRILTMMCRSQWSPLWIPWDRRDFGHGKSMLASLDFDAMSYSEDTLTDLAVEIFMEVLLRSSLVLYPKL